MNFFIKPGVNAEGKPLVVRDPASGKLLDVAGEWKAKSPFWLRLQRDGDVIETAPMPAPATTVSLVLEKPKATPATPV
jgi:hypothetical protein